MASHLRHGSLKRYFMAYVHFLILFLAGLTIGTVINIYVLDWCKGRDHPRVSLFDSVNSSVKSSPVKYVVPNIIHFIWFSETGGRPLTFLNYISIRSAHQIHKPDSIFLHCNHFPSGNWWERLWREVPLTIVHREPPVTVHGQKLANMHHRGDIAKLEILIKYGGIYLDYDVITVKSLDPLRVFDVTLGKEKVPKLNFGIVIGRRNATFLRLIYESYRSNYLESAWDYNCAKVPYQLYLKHPDLLHVEPYKLTTPDWVDQNKLWKGLIKWKSLYVVHAMAHLKHSNEVYTPDNIKSLNTTFGELMRYIYYGSSELRVSV